VVVLLAFGLDFYLVEKALLLRLGDYLGYQLVLVLLLGVLYAELLG
jgi:hypothetical protein